MNSEFKINFFRLSMFQESINAHATDENMNRYEIKDNIIYNKNDKEIRKLTTDESDYLSRMKEFYRTNWPKNYGTYTEGHPIEFLGKMNK